MFGWAICVRCKLKVGDHCHEGKYYCKAHWRIVALGATECMGCLGTGRGHANSKPIPGSPTCRLCKGEGVLDP